MTLTAVPGAGYIFDHWEGHLAGTANPDYVIMDADKTVTAVFVPATGYSLSYSVVPLEAGSISVNPAQPSGGYTPDTVVTLTAVSEPDHTFDHWEGDLSGSDNPVSLVMDSDKTVTAVFVPATGCSLSYSVVPLEAGYVGVDPAQPSGGYTPDTVVTLTAVSEPDHTFDHWEGDLSGSDNPVSLVMDSDKTLTAVFEPRLNLSASVSPEEGGTVEFNPSQPEYGYPKGEHVQLTAVPADGYRFDHWEGDVPGDENPTTITVTAAGEVVAVFSRTFSWQGTVAGVIGGAFILLPPSYLILSRLRPRAPVSKPARNRPGA